MKALHSCLLLSAAATLLANASSAQLVRATGHSVHVRASSSPSYSSSRVWVPGCAQMALEHVWVRGSNERVWVEPVWSVSLDSCGNRVRVLVVAGHWETVFHPGHYEVRPVQKRVPGRWVARGSHR